MFAAYSYCAWLALIAGEHLQPRCHNALIRHSQRLRAFDSKLFNVSSLISFLDLRVTWLPPLWSYMPLEERTIPSSYDYYVYPRTPLQPYCYSSYSGRYVSNPRGCIGLIFGHSLRIRDSCQTARTAWCFQNRWDVLSGNWTKFSQASVTSTMEEYHTSTIISRAIFTMENRSGQLHAGSVRLGIITEKDYLLGCKGVFIGECHFWHFHQLAQQQLLHQSCSLSMIRQHPSSSHYTR